MSCCQRSSDCCYFSACGPCNTCGPCSTCPPCCEYANDCCKRPCRDCYPKRLDKMPTIFGDSRKKNGKSQAAALAAATKKNASNKRATQTKAAAKKADDDALAEGHSNSSNFTGAANTSCSSNCTSNCCNSCKSAHSSTPNGSTPTSSTHSRAKGKNQYDPKQTKNKKNYQYQDMKKRMEVINEEEGEVESEEDDDPCNSKQMQDSCADFLNIVHDTVLETVQCSVDAILRNYYAHTMERIETLCSQMMRNECLLSKMYLDVLDKLSQQSDKSMRQFKCMCQFMADLDKTSRSSQGRSECSCNYNYAEDNVMGMTKERASHKERRQSRQTAGQGSDTEGRTDGSLTSCTIPKLQAKGKTRDPETSATSVLDDGRNRRHASEYAEVRQKAGGNVTGRRILESTRPSDSYRTLNCYKMQATDSRCHNMRNGWSEADVVRIYRQ